MPRPLEDATGLMIHGPLSLAKQSEIEAERKVEVQNDLQCTWKHMINTTLLRPTEWNGRHLTAEFLVLRGKHKGLRNDMEVFEAVSLLHSLDVFIETVFSRQFIWPGNKHSSQFKMLQHYSHTDRTKIYEYITVTEHPLPDSMIHLMFNRGTGPN